jgi:hypothetical protein
MQRIAAAQSSHGSLLVGLVGHRVGQAFDWPVGRDLEAVEMQEPVEFAEAAFAVAAENCETDRAEWTALEVLGVGAYGRQRELFGGRWLSAGDAKDHGPEPVGELGEMPRGGPAAFDEVDQPAVVLGELGDRAVVVGARLGQGMVGGERPVAGLPEREEDGRAVRTHRCPFPLDRWGRELGSSRRERPTGGVMVPSSQPNRKGECPAGIDIDSPQAPDARVVGWGEGLGRLGPAVDGSSTGLRRALRPFRIL